MGKSYVTAEIAVALAWIFMVWLIIEAGGQNPPKTRAPIDGNTNDSVHHAKKE
jgi:hypothetical protein